MFDLSFQDITAVEWSNEVIEVARKYFDIARFLETSDNRDQHQVPAYTHLGGGRYHREANTLRAVQDSSVNLVHSCAFEWLTEKAPPGAADIVIVDLESG